MSPLLCQGRSICWTAGGDGPHQLRDVLAKLDIDASIGEAELLKTISSPGMALAFRLLILFSAQVSQAPFVVCSTHSRCS